MAMNALALLQEVVVRPGYSGTLPLALRKGVLMLKLEGTSPPTFNKKDDVNIPFQKERRC